MSVYVDDYRGKFRRMVCCHMMADTLAELHAMAAAIGMRREWFQYKGAGSLPHYDVCLTRRKLAIELGAVELPIADRHRWREVVRRCKVTTEGK